jgi:hypothetical protein
LSFDPRGVNGSIPKAECYPDESTRRSNSKPIRSGTLSDTGEMYAWNKNLARACYETMGEHAKYSGRYSRSYIDCSCDTDPRMQ